MMMSCNNGANNNNNTQQADAASKDTGTVKIITISNGINCFAYTQNNDTIFLTLVIKKNVVTGQLIYHLSEKDFNNGNIRGFLYTAILWLPIILFYQKASFR